MPKQIITIEVDADQDLLDAVGINTPAEIDYKQGMNYWIANIWGYNLNNLTVLQAGPVQQTAEEIRAEIEAG